MATDPGGTGLADGQRLAAPAAELVGTTWRVARLPAAAYLLVMAGEAGAPVAAAWLTKLIIDGLVAGEPVGRLVGIAAALAGTGVMAAVLPQAARYLGNEMGRRLIVAATDRLFAAAARLPGLRPFENPGFLDRLRLAQQGISTASTTVAGGFASGRSVLTLIGFVGSLLVISPVMTGVVLAAATPALLAHLHLSRRRAAMLWQLGPVERRQALYGRLLGSVEAAKEIRLFSSAGFLRSRMMTELRTATTARRRMDQRELSVEGLLALLGAVVAGGGLVWAVAAARTGTLTPGDISMFIAAVAAVQGALYSLVAAIGSVYHGLLLLGHHLAVVRAEPDLVVTANPRPLPPLRAGIEFRDVWFRYSDEHPWILRGVNLTIRCGMATALVGPNGAGKSTLVKLLCRFYDPDHGTVCWDGIDLREVHPDQLRERISGVFQDHVEYDLPARDNVAISEIAAAADLSRVRAAARRAGVDEVLSALPQGYQTLLSRQFVSTGDGVADGTGVVLSGGQWQRVALARAFFRDGRDVMVLDEPSAGLDPEAEAELHNGMRRHRAGRTSLLISHRLNTVRDADQIVVIKDGTVAELGDHDALLAAGGEYARLFRLQAEGFQLASPAGGRP